MQRYGTARISSYLSNPSLVRIKKPSPRLKPFFTTPHPHRALTISQLIFFFFARLDTTLFGKRKLGCSSFAVVGSYQARIWTLYSSVYPFRCKSSLSPLQFAPPFDRPSIWLLLLHRVNRPLLKLIPTSVFPPSLLLFLLGFLIFLFPLLQLQLQLLLLHLHLLPLLPPRLLLLFSRLFLPILFPSPLLATQSQLINSQITDNDSALGDDVYVKFMIGTTLFLIDGVLNIS